LPRQPHMLQTLMLQLTAQEENRDYS
ncbi:transcriptional regulator, partial [Pantoea ananatis]